MRVVSKDLPLSPPGMAVNLLKVDAAGHRANSWLEWGGTWELDTAFLGIPFGGASTVVTDKATTFGRVNETARELLAHGIEPLIVGGDHSIAEAAIAGVCEALPGRQMGVIHFDAHHDPREAHFGDESSGVPFRKVLERSGRQVRGQNLVQIGMAEIVEISPPVDVANMTANLGAALALNFFMGVAERQA